MTYAGPMAELAAARQTLFNGYRLNSVFQPIFSLGHRRAVGFEALVRATNAQAKPVSPLQLFASARDRCELLRLDRSCQTLHIDNFAALAPERRWLFLNLDPATISRKAYRNSDLADTLAAARLAPEVLVIEILEAGIVNESLLVEAVDYFRAMGALVALDDFGAGHSNFDRIWRLAPDIIKLDRSLIVEAEQHRSGRLRQVLPNLVSLMHEAGCLVLAEGIETDTQALIAMDADVDLVQGFYFARPQAAIDAESPEATRCLESLSRRFADTAVVQDQQERQDLAPYVDVFRAVADAIEHGAPFERTCASLLDMPRTARCYLLNEWGEQQVHFAGHARGRSKACHRPAGPLADTTGGTWFRRHYFRDAISDPRRHKISRPYLSTTGTDMCITLSVAYPEVPRHVFCCDVYC